MLSLPYSNIIFHIFTDTLGDVCCPSGSYKLDSKCYQIVPEAQTRSQAATVCNGKGKFLLTQATI